MVLSYVLLAVSFVMLLAGAFVFTNAVEWAGLRLNLGHGATGSILAAVATALPESVIPIVAIIAGGEKGAIAVGAILGAPFLLGTLAMMLVGLCALAFRRYRSQGVELTADRSSTMRDLRVFLVVLAAALLLGVFGFRTLNIIAAVVFVAAYGVYVWRTLTRERATEEGEEHPGSLFFDPTKHDPPRNIQIVLQVVVSLALIIYGAHLFVTQIEHIAHVLGVSALVLALVLAPLASELPEKANSFLWVRRGKDTLALGNITGAMVFQSMIPVAAGLAFTDWDLPLAGVVIAICALVGGALCLFAFQRGRRFGLPFIASWGVLYVGATIYIIVGTS